ncbi:hypothetical protein RHSIM_Rhsim04G0107100 [Rhododendron simsii]|uniref:Uncharacterized protein n=1 Tax=Rhododendron simsii TaxID=118357 RepID=A0A834H833_RHOSS|nr:hypothetical protein RHSIM_Rhsim04G0107100 [Rhododendron simsii]
MAGKDCTDGYKDYEEWIQAARESPMPWIGMYVAKASRVCSVAMAGDIPATKSYMELKYNELHEIDCNGGKLGEAENLTNEKLKEVVEKYWVMEETGSPQFVTARSVTSAMLRAICLATTISFLTLAIYVVIHGSGLQGFDSPYRWSTVCIFMIQSIRVVVGTIAPMCRWFTAINFNYNNMFTNHHHKEFKLVETFWIQTLVAWKETPLPSQIRGMKCKRVIGNVKILILNLCIGVQIGIVVASKLVHLISSIITLPLFSCFYYGKRMNVDLRSESSALKANNSSPEFDRYVLQLECEVKLPKSILKNMCHEFEQLILMGKSRQPQNLLELLRKSNNSFKGVVDFDSNVQVQYCWMLPVVTLTSIAVALPGFENHTVDQLMSSVSEGLLYTSLVEESFSYEGDHDLLNLTFAANVIWAGVELNCKWLDKDLRKCLLKGRPMEVNLQTLVNIADKATRIPKERDRSAMEERDKSVRRAAHLLGETEEILAILKHYELLSLSGDRVAYIDEWRSYMMQKDPPALVPSSDNEIPASGSDELHINVDE